MQWEPIAHDWQLRKGEVGAGAGGRTIAVEDVDRRYQIQSILIEEEEDDEDEERERREREKLCREKVESGDLDGMPKEEKRWMCIIHCIIRSYSFFFINPAYSSSFLLSFL